MTKKTLSTLLLLTLALGQPGFAKNDNVPQNNKTKDVIMPSVVPDMKGYEETKKALDEATKEPSVKDLVVDTLKDMAKDAKELAKNVAKKVQAPRLDLRGFSSVSVFPTGSVLSVTFFYDDPSPKNPYSKVIVTYSPTKPFKPLSATGYTITSLDSVPDLSGYDLISSAVRSDGTLANEVYLTGPDATGFSSLIKIDYGFSNDVTSVTQIDSQILGTKHLRLRQLFKAAGLP